MADVEQDNIDNPDQEQEQQEEVIPKIILKPE